MKSTLQHFTGFKGDRYSARLLHDEDAGTPGLTYPGLVEEAWVEGPGIEVVPVTGDPWVARVANTDASPSGITVGLYHPCPTKMCVVARGAGYVINIDNPADWSEVPVLPILGGLISEARRLLVFWDYSRFIAIGEAGITWCSKSVSWDGIGNVSCEDGELTADVWDAPSGKIIRAVVSLDDGRVLRGSSPELGSPP